MWSSNSDFQVLMDICNVASSVSAVLMLRLITYFKDSKSYFGWQKKCFSALRDSADVGKDKILFPNCCSSVNEFF